MRRLLSALTLSVLLFFPMPAAQALDWAGLWRTPDQRGESLLRQGNAAAAAQLYRDPRRKAYAELQAGDYAAAAHDLGAFDDSDADYNRGNALAHAGDLQGAIDAYDAALKRDPHNRDAAHNRELVQNALQQQPPPQQQSNSGQPGQNKSGQNKPGQGNGQDDRQGNDHGASAQSNSASQGSSNDRQQAGNQPRNQQGQDGSGRQDRSGANGPAQSGERQQGGAADAGPTAQGRDDALQARRDAEAALGQAGDQIGGNRIDSAGEPRAPQTEQQLAEQQWLHSIPDDPGGLLRRKFMIEHMLRQQKVQP